MGYSVSLAELQRAGFHLTADEAVAIAQKLIQHPPDGPSQPPFGPLAPERIRVASDGSVACAGCAATPTVVELAILLQDLLARSPHVPGGLRYTIARALHEVDAPPFDSLDDFAVALARYAPRRSDDALRRLVARRDRRRSSRSEAELRLQLRDADRRFFESQIRTAPGPPPPPPRRRWMIGAVVAGALATGAAASVVGDRGVPLPPLPPPPAATARLGPAALPEVHPVVAAAAPHRLRTAEKRRRPAEHARTLRLRLFHKTFTFRDDLTRP